MASLSRRHPVSPLNFRRPIVPAAPHGGPNPATLSRAEPAVSR